MKIVDMKIVMEIVMNTVTKDSHEMMHSNKNTKSYIIYMFLISIMRYITKKIKLMLKK